MVAINVEAAILTGAPPSGEGWLQLGELWITAAVGCAAGAGLPVLAAVTTGAYLLVVSAAFPLITRRLPRSSTAVSSLRVRYVDGRGILRHLLQVVTSHGFTIDEVSTEMAGRQPGPGTGDGTHLVEVILRVYGKHSVNDLAAALSEVSDVDAVHVNDANAIGE